MKYGIREICDVVLRAKAKMTVGDKIFYKDEPVMYFDSLKTSTLEGTATTVYAQGGKGNSRLIAWEGERAITFTMEDALISTLGLAILTGANVINASATTPIYQHIVETAIVQEGDSIKVKEPVHVDTYNNYIYVMKLDDNGNCDSEPYIYTADEGDHIIAIQESESYQVDDNYPKAGDVVLVDYYTTRSAKTQQLEITADKFGGNFYLEASTLFRDTNGQDMPAEFIIPNCKVQSNFTFTMASSGDPSTFTFTMDAFPDYTRWNKTKKVLTAIQIITDEASDSNNVRHVTDAYTDYDADGKFDTNEEMISFKYKDITCVAYNSMTWGEWVNSPYNTINASIDSETNEIRIEQWKCLYIPSSPFQHITANDIILKDVKYFSTYSVVTTLINDDTEINFVPGMTWQDWCNTELNQLNVSIDTERNAMKWFNNDYIADATNDIPMAVTPIQLISLKLNYLTYAWEDLGANFYITSTYSPTITTYTAHGKNLTWEQYINNRDDSVFSFEENPYIPEIEDIYPGKWVTVNNTIICDYEKADNYPDNFVALDDRIKEEFEYFKYE